MTTGIQPSAPMHGRDSTCPGSFSSWMSYSPRPAQFWEWLLFFPSLFYWLFFLTNASPCLRDACGKGHTARLLFSLSPVLSLLPSPDGTILTFPVNPSRLCISKIHSGINTSCFASCFITCQHTLQFKFNSHFCCYVLVLFKHVYISAIMTARNLLSLRSYQYQSWVCRSVDRVLT